MSELKKYNKAMMDNNTEYCIDIEIIHGLYGYPPDLVSIGLDAFDAGNDALEAVEKYINTPRNK